MTGASDSDEVEHFVTGNGGVGQSILEWGARFEALMQTEPHQSRMAPADNKFHTGSSTNGKHYWITPPELYAELDAQFSFDFDPCPHPKPEDFDGLTCEWGQSNYVNPPFGSIVHQGKKKGPTAWARKAITENAKGKRVVLVYPIDKWVLMLLAAGASVRNLGDVRWLATEDNSAGKGTGRHIAAFILEAPKP
jgi:hypothetical protein